MDLSLVLVDPLKYHSRSPVDFDCKLDKQSITVIEEYLQSTDFHLDCYKLNV